jgi:hypothetical protein
MADRLRRAAARCDIAAPDIARILTAFASGLELRARVLEDPHHPQMLHTGRTALILLEDIGFADPDALALAVLFESRAASLQLGSARMRALAGERAAHLANSLPIAESDGDRVLEALLAAEPAATAVAVAERLDHARHLHLEPRAGWASFHERFAAVYVPVAERTHPRLGRRSRWWVDMFARRYLPARSD